MHEYAIAEGIIGLACDHAGGRRIAAVEVRIGHLRQVVPAALAFAFEVASAETAAEGAELEIVSVVPVVHCAACGQETEARELPLACGECGGFDVAILAGEGLEVQSIEVFNDERAPYAEQEVV